jgi:thiosulfate/3-mercaptopyruvate sulfurtransferase
VVVVDAEASPAAGETLLRTIRSVTKQPIRWLVLTHHHPDHHFGAIVFRRAGAKVIAHPDTRTLASEGGPDEQVINWIRVVGLDAMRGFEYADTPDRPVTGSDTLRIGGRAIVVLSPGPAHTPGDLMVWLPAERVLFAGDVLIEDGVTMMVDGGAPALLGALATIDALGPRVAVPGHGAIPADPGALVARTREYVTELRTEMRAAVERGIPMKRALDPLPPADENRPVSLNSRRRRNAVRVYIEEEKGVMGLTGDSAARPRLLSSDQLAEWQRRGEAFRLIDVRTDPFTYLKGHLPDAVYLNTETLRAAERGTPLQILPSDWYAQLFARLGIRWDQPVVVYSAGETHNIDATFLVWLLAGYGHPRVYLLDGGYFKWELEQRPIAKRYPKLVPASPPPGTFRPDVASLDDVRRAVERHDALLVDARPPDQYAGEAGAQMRRGHIPGAVNHYWQDDLGQEGFGRIWKPADSLRATYRAQGITPDRRLILYCNSTTEASHVFFALKFLLSYPDVRIYTGSWTEWSEREELPLETGGTEKAGAPR